MRHWEIIVPSILRVTVASLVLLLSAAAQAASIKVLCDGPLEPALPAIAEAFRGKTGHRVEFVFAPSPVIQKKIADGETADLVIIQPDFLAALAASGKVDAGDHPAFARVGIGLAARADAPAREIKTADALKQVLLRADTIVVNNVASGNYFAKVLERLGIADEVAPRLRTFPNGQTAMAVLAALEGGRPIGCTQITEILNTKGVTLVGNLPDEFALATVYTLGICAKAQSPELARRFAAMLTGEGSRELRRKLGFAS
jgi:molybdate transport system substrate-binding protein